MREVRGHLTTQETEVKFQTESVDIRALSNHGLRNKVDESHNINHEQKGNLFPVAYRGGDLGCSNPPPEIPKALQNRAKLNPTAKTVKNS